MVDDSELVRTRVRAALGAGHAFLDAADGARALELLEAHAVDLVVTDFMMPAMTGLDLVERMRRSERTAGIPVLVLSTQATRILVDKAHDLGVTAWLRKPFDPAALTMAATSLLAKRGA